MKEIIIELRATGLSIQAPGILSKKKEAIELLLQALTALKDEPHFEGKNELVYNAPEVVQIKQPNKKRKLLSREKFGEIVFQAIKAEVIGRGFSLWEPHFDPAYPISLRHLHNIKKGMFDIKTLNTLPGIKVEEWFCIIETAPINLD